MLSPPFFIFIYFHMAYFSPVRYFYAFRFCFHIHTLFADIIAATFLHVCCHYFADAHFHYIPLWHYCAAADAIMMPCLWFYFRISICFRRCRRFFSFFWCRSMIAFVLLIFDALPFSPRRFFRCWSFFANGTMPAAFSPLCSLPCCRHVISHHFRRFSFIWHIYFDFMLFYIIIFFFFIHYAITPHVDYFRHFALFWSFCFFIDFHMLSIFIRNDFLRYYLYIIIFSFDYIYILCDNITITPLFWFFRLFYFAFDSAYIFVFDFCCWYSA